MPREIVVIQCGQAGNSIANAFWQTTTEEHNITKEGNFQKSKILLKNTKNEDDNKTDKDYELLDNILLSKANVYFDEIEEKTIRYVPRTILVDLEPGVLDKTKAGPFGKLFKPDNFISGANGAGNNFAKGFYTEGMEMSDEIMDIIRLNVEGTDCLQAFQLCHSLGGGTGSGLGSRILEKARDEYPNRITSAFSIYPSPQLSDVVVEPYNAVLALEKMIENCDQSFSLDNEALVDIISNSKVETQQKKGFGPYNELISYVMSGLTASLRFPGQLNGDLRKLGVNLTPFPRLHFYCVSQAPLLSKHKSTHTNLTVQELRDEALNSKNYFVKLEKNEGKFLTCSLLFRGNLSSFEVDQQIARSKFDYKYFGQFVNWIPNSFKYSIINVPPKYVNEKGVVKDLPMAATFAGNHTGIASTYKKFVDKYKTLVGKKAFLHWYFDEGMELDEFKEAEANIQDLITEYKEKTDVWVDPDNPMAVETKENDDINEDDELANILSKYEDDDDNNNDKNEDNNNNDDDNKNEPKQANDNDYNEEDLFGDGNDNNDDGGGDDDEDELFGGED